MSTTPTMLALIEAGHITEDDATLGLMQGIGLDNARSVADWLALATNGPVKLRWITIGQVEHIETTPEDVRKRIKTWARGAA